MGDLRMERRFAVPPAELFEFLTAPANVAQWWGPENMSMGEHRLDLTRPGPWFFVLVDPSGGQHRMSGEVRAVDPPHSVELTMTVPGPQPIVDSLVRFEVTADGHGSRLVLTQSGLTDEMIVAGSTRGWVAVLDRLERLVAKRPR